jgi:hypothetical protein
MGLIIFYMPKGQIAHISGGAVPLKGQCHQKDIPDRHTDMLHIIELIVAK